MRQWEITYLEKAPGMQVVSIVFAEWKTWQHENVTVKRWSNLITQDERINIERDEMNEVGKSIYAT